MQFKASIKLAAVLIAAVGAIAGFGGQAQTGGVANLIPARSGQGEVLVMPADAMPADAMPGTAIIDGLRIEAAMEGAFRVYRAHYKGRTHTAYAPLHGPVQRYAFDKARGRFAAVTPNLLVRMADYGELDAVVAAAGALRGKAYPALGWALLELPAQANPAEVAQRLLADPLVTSAEVQLQGAMHVPM